MTTSGIYTYERTLNQVATESLELIEAVGDGETLSGDHIERSRASLNSLLLSSQTQGMHLWTETEGTLFLKVGQAIYDFRDSSTHVANDYNETTTTADTTAATLTIPVTSIEDINDGDVIGIVQSDNDIFWTTVNGAPTGLNVIVDDPVTLTTLSGAFVRSYSPSTATAPALTPISRISPGQGSVRRKEADDYEIPIIFESRKDYFNLPNKAQLGTPIQAYYSRQDIAGQVGGIMYLWNAPDSSVPVINFTYERKIQMMVNPDDTLDTADYAHEYIIYNLAKRLILKFGCGKDRAQLILDEAERTKLEMLAYGASMYPIQMKMVQS
jgi:hypothetical protein